MGKKKLIAETGAGQHGVALATVKMLQTLMLIYLVDNKVSYILYIVNVSNSLCDCSFIEFMSYSKITFDLQNVRCIYIRTSIEICISL